MTTWIEQFTQSQAVYAHEIKESYPTRKARVSFVKESGGVVLTAYLGDDDTPAVVLCLPPESWAKVILLEKNQEISWVGLTWDEFVATQKEE